MTDWRTDLLDRLRAHPTLASVEPYGSVAAGTADAWSDLDVRVVATEAVSVEDLLGSPLWAWQRSGAQSRLVTADGRFVDLAVEGPEPVLPPGPADLEVRFDAALAALRLGRGNQLIGLHLVLGIGREALVQSMRTADAATGTVHHRLPTTWDARAAEVAALTAGPLGPLGPLGALGPLGPEVALDAYRLYGRWRAEREPGYAPDDSGLRALLRSAAR